MKAKRLPSGSWRVQVLDYVDAEGKAHRRSFTANTKEEAELAAAQFKLQRTEGGRDGTVEDMMERAIRQKAPALSPSTLRGYEKILRNMVRPSAFSKVRLHALSSDRVQVWISWMIGKGYSPKSVKNAVGAFTSCYQFSGGSKTFRVKIPQKSARKKHVPSVADVKAVLEYFKNDPDMTAAIQLAAFCSLRRGEIGALTAKDVDRKKHTVRVNKAETETPSGEWIVKVPKTAASVRIVPAPDFVLDSIPKTGKVVNIPTAQITNRFCRAVAKLPVEPFSFHDLRHFYASMAHNHGMSDITIQSSAGWSSSSTMKDIYWGEIAEEARRQILAFHAYLARTFAS